MDDFKLIPASALPATAVPGAERVTGFLQKVYGWMFLGLGITAFVSFTVVGSPATSISSTSSSSCFASRVGVAAER